MFFHIICFLFIAILALVFWPYKRQNEIISQKNAVIFGLFVSVICFFLSTTLWVNYNREVFSFQYLWSGQDIVDMFGYIRYNFFGIESNQIDLGAYSIRKMSFFFGVDGISLFFILLTTFTVPLCLLVCFRKDFTQGRYYVLYFLLLELFLLLAFTALDLMVFFIFFESVLIPMLFLIGIWGSKERKVRAAFYFVLYTLAGSVFLFFAILIFYFEVGSTSFCILTKLQMPLEKQLCLWLFIYFAFSVKIPTIPFHIWLPEAHVEAPTGGSVILAGLLLKLGGYGCLRVLLPVLPEATNYFLPLVYTLCLVSILYASLTTVRQIDMKRIIAYSSIAHMNLVVLGIFSLNIQGLQGGLFLMLAHGVVSAALFFLIGVVYDKYHTRLLQYYGGLVHTMPEFSTYLLIFSFANIGVPGTCNFVGELVVFVGLVDRNFFVLFVALIGVVLSALYTIFFFNRLVFGNLKVKYVWAWQDMTKIEFTQILPLGLLTIFLGVMPNCIFAVTNNSIFLIVEQLKVI